MTSLYLGIVLFSFFVHFLVFFPFIDFLYNLKFQRQDQTTKDPFDKPTPIFDKFNRAKKGTPVGGGILIVLLTSLMYLLFIIFFLFKLPAEKLSTNYPSLFSEMVIIITTFILFFLLGLYDDLNKIFFWKKRRFFGLRLRHKLILELIFAGIVSIMIFFLLRIDFIHIPFYGALHLGYGFIPFAMFVIVAFCNAMNITDGIDGLSSGVLMIALSAFWVISTSVFDIPTLLFIAVFMGGLIAFLYFNIYPARIFLGDSGALSFGATFAVIGLILGKALAMPIISGVMVIEIATSLLQLIWKRFFGRKLFPVAPLHLYLQYRGWPEPKVTMRLWVLSILFAILGLSIAFLN